ncbi:MAG: RNA polymerase sigma-70 factor [Reichenbachiella sp.]
MKELYLHNDSLIAAISDGNEIAFRKFFNEHYPKLLQFSYTIIHNQTFAEEIVQDVFSSLWNNRNSLKEINNINAYLYTATRNRTIDFLRARKNDISNISLEAAEFINSTTSVNPENLLLADELFKILNAVILQLPEKGQMIYRMVKEEDMTYKQVAELLNISEKTVDSHLCTSIKKIRSAVTAYLVSIESSSDLKIV